MHPFQPKLPDILEVRCNIEVHEQIQFEPEDSYDYDLDDAYTDDLDANESSDHLLDDATDTIPLQLSTDYKFSRRSGHHVEIHFDFTVQGSDCLKIGFSDILKLYLIEKMHVCETATRVVHTEL